MPAPMIGAAGAALGGFASLFSFNKANYLYDRGQYMTRAFTGIGYKLQQFGLYRQDVRDLVSLTTNTTSNYHLVATLELGMCVTLLGPARLPEDVPEWVLWFTIVAICNAFAILACSMWLATRAAIIADSLNIRLQTQYIRLPFPSDKTLDKALTKAEDYEADIGSIFRLPVLTKVFDKLVGKPEEKEVDDGKLKRDMSCKSLAALGRRHRSRHDLDGIIKGLNKKDGVEGPRPLLSESHLNLYRQLQKQWQGFDAYARVTISIGTYWLVLALAYYKIGWTLCHQRQALPAVGVGILFAATVALLMYMDLHITRTELVITCVLVFAGPVCVLVGAAQQPYLGEITTQTPWAAVTAGISHSLFTAWVWYSGQCEEGEVHLPTRFLGVQYLDVFGPMINEIRSQSSSMGIAVKNDAVDAFERTKEDLKQTTRQARRYLCGRGQVEVDECGYRKQDARDRLRCALSLRSGSLRHRKQVLATAIQIADASGIYEDDAQVAEAKRARDKLKTLQELTRLQRLLSRWRTAGFMKQLDASQNRQVQRMCEDVELRVSQLQPQVHISGTPSISRTTSHANSDSEGVNPAHVHSVKYDAGGYGDPKDEYEYWVDDADDDDSPDNYTLEHPSVPNAKRIANIANKCEEVLMRADQLLFDGAHAPTQADRLLFDAVHALKQPGPVLLGKGDHCSGPGKGSTSKGVRFNDSSLPQRSGPSKHSLVSASTVVSSKSSASGLGALVKHAVEPLHKSAPDHINFENTLAMTMPITLYNTLMGVLMFVWLGGVGVHVARIANVQVAWYIRPIPVGRSLSEKHSGSFLGQRFEHAHTVGALEDLAVEWPQPFFRPQSLVCTASGSDMQPTNFIASNRFLVFSLAGRRSGPEQIHCPLASHDALVTASCSTTEGCSAIVAAEGALWQCGRALLGESEVKPLASLPKSFLKENKDLQIWAAADYNVTRLFAAPRKGPILELRRVYDAVVPVAELQVPAGMPREMQWQMLSVQGGRLLAMASPEPTVYAWNLAMGTYIGSWRLRNTQDPMENPIWCTSGEEASSDSHGSNGVHLHGLATSPGGSGQGAELRRAWLPIGI